MPPAHRTSRLARKEMALRLLAAHDLSAVDSWASTEPQAERVLQSLLFDADELIRWRAVEALGRVGAVRARRSIEPVREMLRRVLWLMNDESGGLLWAGPQVMGAVLAHVPGLRPEFGAIVASFLEEEPFRVGARWALWRLAGEMPDLVRREAGRLAPSSADPDPAVRGHAAAALHAVGCDAAAFAQDAATFSLFDHRTGALRTLSVAEAASAP